MVLVGALVAAAALSLTPSVADAESRARDFAASHGAVDRAQPVPVSYAAAVVATEDGRFYSHHGVDTLGVLRAAGSVVTGGGEDPGGSTLDQQLAKALYFDGQRGGPTVKLEQLTLAVKLDATYTKAQILEMYAGSIYFGHGFYGLHDAACGYFGVTPAALSPGQAALLAGLPQAPSNYDPIAHPDLARQRQTHVLDRMVADGALTPAAADQARAAPWALLDGPGRRPHLHSPADSAARDCPSSAT